MRRQGAKVGLLGLAIACAYATTAAAQADNDPRYGPVIEVTEKSAKPQGTYVVQKGDTLWGLSEGLFGDPQVWPTLWSFNPQITNPHWIYPGDLLYLRPRITTRAEKTVVFAKSRFSESPRLMEVLARFTSFVTEREYRESGRISYSREEKTMLGELDEAYLKFNIPKRILPGEEYTVYRPLREVMHPVTGKSAGWLIQHLGVARVLSVERDKPFVKGIILNSYEEIQRDDLLTKRVWDKEIIVPVENKVAMWSRILDAFRDINELGEWEYVVVEGGFKQKIRRGNRFVIRERGDGYYPTAAGDMEKLPWENVGEVLIIEPFDNTSLGIVLRSIKDVGKGHLLELIRGY